MPRKPKFKPEITRVKLNPEQAVLSCACYDTNWGLNGREYWAAPPSDTWTACTGGKGYDFHAQEICYGVNGGWGSAQLATVNTVMSS